MEEMVEIRIKNIYRDTTSDDANTISEFVKDCFPESVIPIDWSDFSYHIEIEDIQKNHKPLPEWAISVLINRYGIDGASQSVVVWFQDSLSTIETNFQRLRNKLP